MSGNGGGLGVPLKNRTGASASGIVKHIAKVQAARKKEVSGEIKKMETAGNTLASGGNYSGHNFDFNVAGVDRERMEALTAMFDSRVEEIQQSRLQPGRQTTMITGRQ